MTEIMLAEEGDEFAVYFDGSPFGDGNPFGPPTRIDGALSNVVSAVGRLALDADPSRLHLHCAALSIGGRGVLISAASGTGKTVLAATLARRGWTYVSDEAVGLDTDSSAAYGFPKPLLLKQGGPALAPYVAPAHPSLGSLIDAWSVPASTIPAAIADELEPALVVILRRADDGSTDEPPVPRPMHPVEAAVALMSQSLDPERFGLGAVAVVARLVSHCLCVMLPVGPPDATAEIIEQLIIAPHSPMTAVELASPDPGASDWRIPSSVRSVMIGERAVLHNNIAGGVVAPLDEAGTAIWLAVHGQAPNWLPTGSLAEPGTLAFLDQLESHGLLSRDLESAGA